MRLTAYLACVLGMTSAAMGQTGACWFSCSNCTIETEADCMDLGGLYAGDGKDCNAAPYPPHLTMELLVVAQQMGDYDPNNPGNEALWSYLVVNRTIGGFSESMQRVVLPAGSEDGVFEATAPPGWNTQIGVDQTTFWSDSDLIGPCGGLGFFQLYSDYLGSRIDVLEAVPIGEGSFSPVTTCFPQASTGCSSDLDGEPPHPFALNSVSALGPGAEQPSRRRERADHSNRCRSA